MNERIQELIKEATTTSFNQDGAGFHSFSKVKFAELIVRECAEIAMREDHDPAECIKRHFGVEE